jgi:hypothetical protein
MEFRAPGGGGGEPRPKPDPPDMDGLFEKPDRQTRMYVPQPQQDEVGERVAFADAFEAALSQAFES